jgi:hypothetical protein
MRKEDTHISNSQAYQNIISTGSIISTVNFSEESHELQDAIE